MPSKKSSSHAERRVTLKTIADHLSLTMGTVSAALNDSAAARSIPERTKQRILDAARELNYQPNYFARSLRLRRTFTIGVIMYQIGDPYGATVISGIESALRDTEYLFLTAVHRHDREVMRKYAQMLLLRGAEGFIIVDSQFTEGLQLPTVAIAGHKAVENVTNLVVNQERAAYLALCHLKDLGHREIAFIRGQTTSSDAAKRWDAICIACRELGIAMHPELTVRIEGDPMTPYLGYPYAKMLLAQKRPFTALFAFNDLAAIGAIAAFHEAGLRVPEDISVVGFDDLPIAAFSNPPLTTIRQPLEEMGQTATRTLIHRIETKAAHPLEIVIEPELIVRASTGPVRR
jgi:DNA-binding LacI/PurR family transcriptional regulator